ncbi:hypothetical protein [Delftia acidovorans]|uniref:hypothetical protein n=1 Tax=Delftia acidovorans TaxID=80866 RepID=UPI002FDD9611
MSKYELQYTPVAAYKVGDKILTSVSSWNGLEELRDEKGRKLIVSRAPRSAFRESFCELFQAVGLPMEPGTMMIMSGTPDLLVELGLIAKSQP